MGSGGAAGQWIVGARLIWVQMGRGATAVAEDQTGGWARPPPGSGYGWSGTAAVAEDQTGGGVRTPFYGEFLRAAKAVWLLHLLAFALEPPPSHFEAGRGAEFHPEYMESVAGSEPRGGGMVVGFAVAPGFKLCNAAVVRARVYLVPRGSRQ